VAEGGVRGYAALAGSTCFDLLVTSIF
jgi:hypothetical protein